MYISKALLWKFLNNCVLVICMHNLLKDGSFQRTESEARYITYYWPFQQIIGNGRSAYTQIWRIWGWGRHSVLLSSSTWVVIPARRWDHALSSNNYTKFNWLLRHRSATLSKSSRCRRLSHNERCLWYPLLVGISLFMNPLSTTTNIVFSSIRRYSLAWYFSSIRHRPTPDPSKMTVWYRQF